MAIFSAGDGLATLGLLSAGLTCLGYLPYLRDIILGRTHPQRASWLIWSVLGSIALASQVYEGAMASLAFAPIQLGATILIFVMSVFLGSGRYLCRNDYAVLAAAAAGLLMWYWMDNAAYALAITITISLLGGTLAAVKAYRAPETETLSTWVIFWAASGLATLSVGELDPILLAYPLYLFALYTVISGAVILGRSRRMGLQAQA